MKIMKVIKKKIQTKKILQVEMEMRKLVKKIKNLMGTMDQTINKIFRVMNLKIRVTKTMAKEMLKEKTKNKKVLICQS